MYSLLILGANGYLGKLVANYFQELKNFTVYRDSEKYIANSNVMKKYSDLQNLIVVNCIGVGVSRGSHSPNFNEFESLTINLVNNFSKSENLKKYIQFGSIYELLNQNETFFRDDAYVQSKRNISQLSRTVLVDDKRVIEVFLPLVISENLPQGRMYTDLIFDLLDKKPFKFQSPCHPALSISKLDFLEILSKIFDESLEYTCNSIVIQPKHTLTNLGIGLVIGEILEELTGDSFEKFLIYDPCFPIRVNNQALDKIASGEEFFVAEVSEIVDIKKDLKDLVSRLLEVKLRL
jgi:hypothetical protein